MEYLDVLAVDMPISEDKTIPLPSNLIGITITNQGNADLKVSMNSENPVKKVLSGSDVSYGNLNGDNKRVARLIGFLKIHAPDGWSDMDIVITYFYAQEPQQSDDCD